MSTQQSTPLYLYLYPKAGLQDCQIGISCGCHPGVALYRTFIPHTTNFPLHRNSAAVLGSLRSTTVSEYWHSPFYPHLLPSHYPQVPLEPEVTPKVNGLEALAAVVTAGLCVGNLPRTPGPLLDR